MPASTGMGPVGQAKLQLGWDRTNSEDYKRWRRNIKAQARHQKITGRRGTSNEDWNTFKSFAMQDNNGIPRSGRALLELPRGNKQGDDARESLHLLLLDSLKKTQETEVKEKLSAATRKRKEASDVITGPKTVPQDSATNIVRLTIIKPDLEDDVVDCDDKINKWADANQRQLVKLQNRTLREIYMAIKGRILPGKRIRVMFGALDKPPLFEGGQPD